MSSYIYFFGILVVGAFTHYCAALWGARRTAPHYVELGFRAGIQEANNTLQKALKDGTLLMGDVSNLPITDVSDRKD